MLVQERAREHEGGRCLVRGPNLGVDTGALRGIDDVFLPSLWSFANLLDSASTLAGNRRRAEAQHRVEADDRASGAEALVEEQHNAKMSLVCAQDGSVDCLNGKQDRAVDLLHGGDVVRDSFRSESLRELGDELEGAFGVGRWVCDLVRCDAEHVVCEFDGLVLATLWLIRFARLDVAVPSLGAFVLRLAVEFGPLAG